MRCLHQNRHWDVFSLAGALTVVAIGALSGAPAVETEEPPARQTATRDYENRLTRLVAPAPLLADHPEFIEPIRETVRYEAPQLVDRGVFVRHGGAWGRRGGQRRRIVTNRRARVNRPGGS